MARVALWRSSHDTCRVAVFSLVGTPPGRVAVFSSAGPVLRLLTLARCQLGLAVVPVLRLVLVALLPQYVWADSSLGVHRVAVSVAPRFELLLGPARRPMAPRFELFGPARHPRQAGILPAIAFHWACTVACCPLLGSYRRAASLGACSLGCFDRSCCCSRAALGQPCCVGYVLVEAWGWPCFDSSCR